MSQHSYLEKLLQNHGLPLSLMSPKQDARFPQAPIPHQIVLPGRFVKDATGWANYRRPSKSGLERLGNSFSQGLLEPPVFNIDPLLSSMQFIDGRRRFGAALLKGYEGVESHVYVGLTPAMIEQLELSLNTTKESISSTDLALFAKEVYVAFTGDDPSFTKKDLADFLFRNPSTVQKYLQFANMDLFVRDYVREHQDLDWYSKAVYLAKIFTEHKDQREFFLQFLDKEYDLSSLTLSQVKKHVEAQKEFSLQLGEAKVSNKYSSLKKKIFSSLRILDRHLFAAHHLLKVSPEMKNYFKTTVTDFGGTFDEELSFKKASLKLKQTFARNVKKSHPTILKILAAEQVRKSQSFEQRYEYLINNSKNSLDENLRLWAGDVHLIPIEKIQKDSYQLRTQRDMKKVQALAQDMKTSFQVKPGIVMPVDKGYQIVVGEGRYEAVRIAGIPYYRAFIVNELGERERLFIQAIEDLSEKDTFMDQARKIDHIFRTHKDWYMKQGKRYTENNFLKEFGHLASPRVMRHALTIMQLPQDIQYFMDEGIVSKKNGLLLGKFPKETRFELMYSFFVQGYSNHKLEAKLKEAITAQKLSQKGIVQSKLFAVRPSYERSYHNITSQLGLLSSTIYSHISKLEDYGSSRSVYLHLGRTLQKLEELKSLW